MINEFNTKIPSLRFDAGDLDYFPPVCKFTADVGGELDRCAADGIGSKGASCFTAIAAALLNA